MQPVALPLLLTVALMSALHAGPAAAQYRWKDAKGQVHASDLPPPREIPDKDILQRPSRDARLASPGGRGSPLAAAREAPERAGPAGAAPARPASGPVDPELAARRKQAELDAQARARLDDERQAALRADNCDRARAQLANLDSSQRLVRQNAQGERVVLDDTARAADAEAARRVVTSDCR